MMSVLQQISMTCFFSSYLVVLVLEGLRVLGRIPGRALAVIAMMAVGLFTHVVYLSLRANSGGGAVLASWTDWSLLVALGLAIAFVWMYVRRPDTVVGFFLLPAVLATIAMAWTMRGRPSFDRGEAVDFWRTVHAVGMSAGTAAVLLGFLAGVMYLVQSRRLKQKRAGSRWRLPTLEALRTLGRRCLIASTLAVSVGFVSGVVMNANQFGEIPWTDRGIITSAVLAAWLAVATGLEIGYRPATGGRKMALMTLASFGFLVLAVGSVLTTAHGQVAL